MRLPMGRSATGRRMGKSRDASKEQEEVVRAEVIASTHSSSAAEAKTTAAAKTSTSSDAGPVKVGTTLAAASSSSSSSSSIASASASISVSASHASSSSAVRTSGNTSSSAHSSVSSSAAHTTSSGDTSTASTSASLIFLTSFGPNFPVETASAAAKTDGPNHVFVTNQLGDSAIMFALFWVAGLLGTVVMIRCTKWADGRRGRQGDQMISDDIRWAEGREVFGERKIVWEGGPGGAGRDESAGLLDGPVSVAMQDTGRGQRARAPLGPSKLRR